MECWIEGIIYAYELMLERWWCTTNCVALNNIFVLLQINLCNCIDNLFNGILKSMDARLQYMAEFKSQVYFVWFYMSASAVQRRVQACSAVHISRITIIRKGCWHVCCLQRVLVTNNRVRTYCKHTRGDDDGSTACDDRHAQQSCGILTDVEVWKQHEA